MPARLRETDGHAGTKISPGRVGQMVLQTGAGGVRAPRVVCWSKTAAPD